MADTRDNLRQLYRDTVLDHSRNPRHFGRLDEAGLSCEGNNPLCGDRLTVYVAPDQQDIHDIGFDGNGCAISMASASIMTEALAGRSLTDARTLANKVMAQFVAARADEPLDGLGDMAALGAVRSYPSRIKCAILPWKTLIATLDGRHEAVSTE